MKEFNWVYPHRTMVHFGPGALKELPQLVAPYGAHTRIMLFTGRSAMKQTGILDRVLDLLGARRVVLFDKVSPNPTTTEVHEAAALYKQENCGLVIGLGGGSALDAAKAAALMVRHPGDLADYMLQKKTFGPGAEPVLTINTTAGTGSEVNAAFVATIPEIQNKYALAAPAAWPAHAIVDPELCLHLPADQTASTGLDALSHACESLWCRRSQPAGDASCYEAIRVVLEWLPRTVAAPDDIECRTRMSYAALTAGFALLSTGTAVAHGMSYPISARRGAPHGFACTFVLPQAFEFNMPALGDEKKARVFELLKVSSEQQAVDTLQQFCETHGAPKRLADVGLGAGDIPELVRATNPFNCANNLREISPDDLTMLWEKKL
jgi:phosphonate metabolism-associated iron-containing alcohol dehydrogenase